MDGQILGHIFVTYSDRRREGPEDQERLEWAKSLVRLVLEWLMARDHIHGNRAKGEFLAMVSHELRTPLHGMLGMTELLLDSPLTSRQRTLAEQCRSSGNSLLRLIDQLLDFSKIEADRLDLVARVCDLQNVVQGAIDMMADLATSKGLHLTVDIWSDAKVTLHCDDLRLQQILLNLIGNAIKFTSEGTIAVSVTRLQPRSGRTDLRFAITDTGIGIPDERRVMLFQPYSQVDGSITRRFGGTGLGLFISRRLVELMGGTIGVDSTVGVGSTFWFEIPVVVVNEPTSDAVPRDVCTEAVLTQSPNSRIQFSGHVLVAEDNRINQIYIVELLRHFGCTSETVRNGDEALDAIANGHYDLILMDCQMPELDGLSAAQEVRRREEYGILYGRRKIVALTASALYGDRQRCLAAGMDEYLCKPFQPAELIGVLDKYLWRSSGSSEDDHGQ